jgi:rhamnosyltransferase
MIRRLCIYLIYDPDRIVDEYIGTVLSELRKFSDKLVVVCNFESIKSGESYVTEYADEVFCRKNIGYDAGGYQQALSEFVTWEKVYEYDELLLTNDTWFGPIYPFGEMMEKMHNVKCDYWGITRHPEGKLGDGTRFSSHIQSYFLDFRSNVLHDKKFKKFWDEYVSANDKIETIKRFELGINGYLEKNGFLGKSYMELFKLSFNEERANPYNMHTYELLRDIRMPLMKKTIIDFDNSGYVNVLKALEFVRLETNFDYSLIEKYMDRKKCMGRRTISFDFECMENFLQTHTRIFFYGYGVWAHTLADYFAYRNWPFDGYLVSEINENPVSEDVQCFFDADIRGTDGIIIAQKNKSVCEDIVSNVLTRCSRGNILTPIY